MPSSIAAYIYATCSKPSKMLHQIRSELNVHKDKSVPSFCFHIGTDFAKQMKIIEMIYLSTIAEETKSCNPSAEISIGNATFSHCLFSLATSYTKRKK